MRSILLTVGLVLCGVLVHAGCSNSTIPMISVDGGCTVALTAEPPQAGDPPNLLRALLNGTCDWGNGVKPSYSAQELVTFNSDMLTGTLAISSVYTLPDGAIDWTGTGTFSSVPDAGHLTVTFGGPGVFDGGTGSYKQARGVDAVHGASVIDLATFNGAGAYSDEGFVNY